MTLSHGESVDKKLMETVNGQRMVSKLHKLLSNSTHNCCITIKSQWEKELEVSLTTEQWEEILQHSNYLSNCLRYKVIQLKILFRACITPQRF